MQFSRSGQGAQGSLTRAGSTTRRLRASARSPNQISRRLWHRRSPRSKCRSPASLLQTSTTPGGRMPRAKCRLPQVRTSVLGGEGPVMRIAWRRAGDTLDTDFESPLTQALGGADGLVGHGWSSLAWRRGPKSSEASGGARRRGVPGSCRRWARTRYDQAGHPLAGKTRSSCRALPSKSFPRLLGLALVDSVPRRRQRFHR